MNKIILTFLMLVLVLLVTTPGYGNLNTISKVVTGDASNYDNHANTKNDSAEPPLAKGVITLVVSYLLGYAGGFVITGPVSVPICIITLIACTIGYSTLIWRNMS